MMKKKLNVYFSNSDHENEKIDMWKWEVAEPRGVVVMVHGAGEHHARYGWLCENWNKHGFEVIMGDLPGQGKSQGKRGHIQSFNQYIDAVEEWLNEARIRK